MKAVQFAVQSMTKESKYVHVHIKSDNKTAVANLKRGGDTHSGLLLKITDMVVMPIQAVHAYCRVSPRETEHSGRLGESTHDT